VEFWEGCTQFEGLAQSKNNTKLNNSAKHDQTLLVTSETEKEVKKMEGHTSFLFFSFFLFSIFLIFFQGAPKTDNMNTEDLK
jgi:hypothetical protein